MKRVLCLVSGMDAGGAETFLMKVYRKLDKSQYQMDFCVNLLKECVYDKEIKQLGGKIFHITQKSKNPIKFQQQLFNIIKKNHYRYVLRITSNAAGLWDLMIAKKAGAKVCIARSSNSSDGDSIYSKALHTLGKALFMRYVDVMIAPSDLAAKYTFGVQNVKNGKVHMLKNGIDLNVYKYSELAREKIRNEFGICGRFVIGHIGRFTKQKNHLFLIDIFFETVKKNKEAILLLVGIGELEQEIKKKVFELNIQDKVIFAGLRKDIPDILSAMDVFVFPSFYEGMPNTVIEAQATGLPCIISDRITKKANITGLVKYLSLKNVMLWAEEVERINSEGERFTPKDMFQKKGYYIETIVDQFVGMIFGEHKNSNRLES